MISPDGDSVRDDRPISLDLSLILLSKVSTFSESAFSLVIYTDIIAYVYPYWRLEKFPRSQRY